MSVAELQLINKVLTDGDYSIIEENSITKEHLPQVSKEFTYIADFYKQYKAVPDKLAFSEKFPEFEYIAVNQPTRSIIDELREQCLFRRAVSVINESSTIFEKNANKGAEFLLSQLDYLQPTYNIPYTDIMHDTKRLQEWKERQKNPEGSYIPLPLKEMADMLYGYQRGEELFLWLGKSGLGKSFTICKSAEVASAAGYKVGIISPEMSTSSLSYRIDSSRTHFSNISMQKGLLIPGYEKYFNDILASDEHIFVADSNDFGGSITVNQCRNFVKQTKADILFIDGLVYVKPDGYDHRMSMSDSMGEVGKQLLVFSSESKIPIVAVVQAQRNKNRGIDEEDITTSENIFGSYQLAQAATRMVSINRSASALRYVVVKNRYGLDHNNSKDKENLGFLYNVDLSTMHFTYIPKLDEVKQDEDMNEIAEEAKKEFKYAF